MTSAMIDEGYLAPTQTEDDKKKPELKVWQDRRKDARDARREEEAGWKVVQSFVEGKQWVEWDVKNKRLFDMLEKEEEEGREHYIVNLVAQHMWAGFGRLYAGDFKPPIAFRRDDETAKGVADTARRNFDFAWDDEVKADRVLFDAFLGACQYGTQAVQCGYDKTAGKPMLHPEDGTQLEAPIRNGSPLFGDEAISYRAETYRNGGQLDTLKLYEGRTTWTPIAPDGILPPPGIKREWDFPWLIIDRIVPVDWVKQRYGARAAKVTEATLKSDDHFLEKPRKIKGHCVLSCGYERPTQKYPKGREYHWTGDTFLEETKELAYQTNGTPDFGVFFLHWRRYAHKFWSCGVVLPLLGSQRSLNRSRSQYIEIKDRSLGRIYTRPNGVNTIKKLKGSPLEVVEVKRSSELPQETQGVGPGSWIAAEAELAKNDMEAISGFGEFPTASLPTGGVAYSLMALMKEEIDRNIGPIMVLNRLAINQGASFTYQAMRKYWPNGKTIAINGPDNFMDVHLYEQSQLPLEFYIRTPKGAPNPEGPGATTQKIFDFYAHCIQGGAPLPPQWLWDSLEAGRMLPIPQSENDAQRTKAEIENENIILHGIQVIPDPSDNHPLHLQVHRQVQAGLTVVGEEYAQQLAALKAHMEAHQLLMQAMQGPAPAELPPGVPQLQGPQGAQSTQPQPGPATPPVGPATSPSQ